MKFEEDDFIKVDIYKSTFIYFLLENNDVVYVGQTTQGISRPFNHYKDKDFDEIRLIYCNKNELNALENKYILKYKPKYNKIINLTNSISISRLKRTIRNLFFKYDSINNITNKRLKIILNKLDIKPFEFKNIFYIKLEDFNKILNFIESNKELSWKE